MSETSSSNVSACGRAAEHTAGFSKACRNGQDAPCTGHCPYGLDIRDLLKKVRRGSIRGAYSVLSAALLFPETLCSLCGHACRDACASEMNGAFIDLPSIERFVIENAPKKGVQKFRVPEKEEKIAVIGAGLCGLSAAYTLSSLGYSVEIFEKESTAGGSLKGRVPEQVYLPEIASVLEINNITFTADTEITDLSVLSGFGGIIIATGKNGNGFGVASPDGGFAYNGNVFAAGELTKAPLTASVSIGKKAATAMDRYLKAAEAPASALLTVKEEDPCVKTAYSEMTREEAAAEAEKCRMCDCTKCADVCVYMQNYKKIPPRFEIDIAGTMNAVDQIRNRSSTRLLMSCDNCGLCEDVCPEHIKTAEVLLEVRTAMSKDKVLPWAFHDFWMRDMDFSRSEKAEVLKKPENGFLYFTGCLLGASDPENVTGSFELLNRVLPGSGIWITCCGIPARWAGETKIFEDIIENIKKTWEECGKPVFLTSCPSCKKTLKEFAPEIEVRSIYEVFAEHADAFANDILKGADAAVFRPCAGRNDEAEKEAVNTLMKALGIKAGELSDAGDRNGCCGYGGHIYYTNPGLYDKVSQKRADADTRPYVTYCANCRDVLTEKGKATAHILKLLSGKGTLEHEKAPTLSERRHNREKVKAYFTGEKEETRHMKLIIPEEVQKDMDRSLILDTDVESVIEYCEQNEKFLCTESGENIGHKRLGMVTYWVKWKREGEEVHVLSAYSHRMRIGGE